MTTDRYEGLCIGGPLDGQWKSDRAPHFRIYENPNPARISAEPFDIKSVTVSVKSFDYRIAPLFTDKTGKKIFIWQVVGKEREGLEIIEDLLDSYARLASLKR